MVELVGPRLYISSYFKIHDFYFDTYLLFETQKI